MNHVLHLVLATHRLCSCASHYEFFAARNEDAHGMEGFNEGTPDLFFVHSRDLDGERKEPFPETADRTTQDLGSLEESYPVINQYNVIFVEILLQLTVLLAILLNLSDSDYFGYRIETHFLDHLLHIFRLFLNYQQSN